jgi:hypothetical protein
MLRGMFARLGDSHVRRFASHDRSQTGRGKNDIFNAMVSLSRPWRYERPLYQAGNTKVVMNMDLKAKHWQNNSRVREAANIPFHSLQFKAWNSDDAGAISLLQFALIKIQLMSPRLLPKDLPTHPDFKGDPGDPLASTIPTYLKSAPMTISPKMPSVDFKFKHCSFRMGLRGSTRFVGWTGS